MTNDEIVRALRNSCAGCNPTPCCELEALGPAAADLIASLQAQLAASQREKRAAVECINGVDEALRFQRYSAAELRISEWRGPQEAER